MALGEISTARRFEVQLGESVADRREPGGGDRHLQILVRSALVAEEQVEGPAAGDSPRDVHGS
ncbi:MAG: hypothetical protein M0Z42_19935 [Actinomycetota bacterium]|nr:hypothetical protein [Actinomycetota bacterium]